MKRYLELLLFALLAAGMIEAVHQRWKIASLVLIGLWIGFALLLLRREDYV